MVTINIAGSVVNANYTIGSANKDDERNNKLQKIAEFKDVKTDWQVKKFAAQQLLQMLTCDEFDCE